MRGARCPLGRNVVGCYGWLGGGEGWHSPYWRILIRLQSFHKPERAPELAHSRAPIAAQQVDRAWTMAVALERDAQIVVVIAATLDHVALGPVRPLQPPDRRRHPTGQRLLQRPDRRQIGRQPLLQLPKFFHILIIEQQTVLGPHAMLQRIARHPRLARNTFRSTRLLAVTPTSLGTRRRQRRQADVHNQVPWMIFWGNRRFQASYST